MNVRNRELVETLEQKTEQIATLEAEVERLTEELAARDREARKPPDEHATAVNESNGDSETPSLWSHTKRLFDGGSG